MYRDHLVSLWLLSASLPAKRSKNLDLSYVGFGIQPGIEGNYFCRENLTRNSVPQISGSYKCIRSDIFRNFLMCHYGTSHIQQCMFQTLGLFILLRCKSTCHPTCNAMSCQETRGLGVETLSSAFFM